MNFDFRDIREKFESFVHPRGRSASKHNQGMAIDAGFPTINAGSTLQKCCPNVRNRVRWSHNGLACGGEGLGPKRIGRRLSEKVNLLVDRTVGSNSIQGVTPLVDAVQDS